MKEPVYIETQKIFLPHIIIFYYGLSLGLFTIGFKLIPGAALVLGIFIFLFGYVGYFFESISTQDCVLKIEDQVKFNNFITRVNAEDGEVLLARAYDTYGIFTSPEPNLNASNESWVNMVRNLQADIKFPDFGVEHSKYSSQWYRTEKRKIFKQYNIHDSVTTKITIFGMSYGQ